MRKSDAIEVERGDVFEVPLEDGRRGYGQVLNATLLGFFAVATDQRLALGEIAQRPVAFRMSCSSAAIRNGSWPVVGRAPLSAEMAKPLRLYRNNGPDWWFLVEWTPETGEVERRVPRRRWRCCDAPRHVLPW